MFSPAQVTGNSRPFQIFSAKSDLAVVHSFISFVLELPGPGLSIGYDSSKKQLLSDAFKQYNFVYYQKLRRIIAKYEIAFNSFLRIVSDAVDLCLQEPRTALMN